MPELGCEEAPAGAATPNEAVAGRELHVMGWSRQSTGHLGRGSRAGWGWSQGLYKAG